MTILGTGIITATAPTALAPTAETYAKGHDFATWLDLAPLQGSTGGKQRLGEISKMGARCGAADQGPASRTPSRPGAHRGASATGGRAPPRRSAPH